MPEPSFADLLASSTRAALKLEFRDQYMTDDPAYLAWRAGNVEAGGPGVCQLDRDRQCRNGSGRRHQAGTDRQRADVGLHRLRACGDFGRQHRRG